MKDQPATVIGGSASGQSHRVAGTMQAVVQDGYGTSDVLRVAEVARPVIGPREVLVEVRAAGLDRGTWHLMQGKPRLLRLVFGLRSPKQPVIGRDVAGVVVEVGSEVTTFAVGDKVFGVAPGSVAEYAVAREDKLAHRPATVTWEQAAVVPISGGTAVQAVVDAGRVAAGQKVLVIGASGGVGSYAVQLAKAAGAEVTGVASAAKADLVRTLGADHVLDYAVDDVADGTRHYDLIIDIAGLSELSRLRRALTPRGTLVLVGGEGGGDWTGGTMGRQLRARLSSAFSGQRLTSVIAQERGADYVRLAALLESGQVVPSLERAYPLAETVDAMRHLEAGRVRGKIAVTARSGA
ncbi:NAD(P)-dependent alcohol dehydrogenase [Terrabacter sp. Soil811]|uniref:NAD(P)-dependent alcohol dehydrogenase n=1 Tax=Terrabacter sp. Soil811 TaxID=1736419 RepID=UPI0009E6EDA0|nr:NAD(P)-dependent alcohol dehydrogenase [Terrabacter sp. Soil811]